MVTFTNRETGTSAVKQFYNDTTSASFTHK